MSSLHNDIFTWAARARRNGQTTIYIDVETADKIVDALIQDAVVVDAAKHWAWVRTAFLKLPMGSPNVKRMLNELSEAEDLLRKSVSDE